MILKTKQKIDQINRLIHERDSRSETSYLKESLNQLRGNLVNENGEVMNLRVFMESENTSNNRIEEIQFKVDTCNGNVEANLQSRKNEPPSEINYHIMDK